MPEHTKDGGVGMTIIQLRLTPEMLQDLDRFCREQPIQVTRTGAIRAAIREFLKNRTPALSPIIGHTSDS